MVLLELLPLLLNRSKWRAGQGNQSSEPNAHTNELWNTLKRAWNVYEAKVNRSKGHRFEIDVPSEGSIMQYTPSTQTCTCTYAYSRQAHMAH